MSNPIFQQLAEVIRGRNDVSAIPLSLRNVGDLLAGRGIGRETVRFRWNRTHPRAAVNHASILQRLTERLAWRHRMVGAA